MRSNIKNHLESGAISGKKAAKWKKRLEEEPKVIQWYWCRACDKQIFPNQASLEAHMKEAIARRPRYFTA